MLSLEKVVYTNVRRRYIVIAVCLNNYISQYQNIYKTFSAMYRQIKYMSIKDLGPN